MAGCLPSTSGKIPSPQLQLHGSSIEESLARGENLGSCYHHVQDGGQNRPDSRIGNLRPDVVHVIRSGGHG